MTDRASCLTFAAEPTTSGAEGKPLGFHGVPYSGGIVPNFGKWGNVVIDLASFKLPRRKSSALLNHDPHKIAGRALVVNDGRRLSIEGGTFSAVTATGKEVSGLMAEGQDFELSVGIDHDSERVDRNKTISINGQQLSGVDTVFRNSRLLEFSFVPSGADPEAYAAHLSARHAHESTETGDTTMDPNPLQARVDELTAQVATLTGERDTARTELKAANDAAKLVADARRKERMTALFGEKPTLTDAQLAAYRTMSDDQFSAVEATFAAQAADPALFQQVATKGRNHEDQGGAPTFHTPSDYPDVDPERAQLHAKALKYQAEHAGTDYLTAVNAVAH